MLYEQYKNKLKRYRRIFDRVWRFRLLILACAVLALAATAAMLGVKGMVYDADIPDTFEYGQLISAEAGSLFGGAEFEYRPVGGEWSQEAPVAAGDYECRPVGRSIVGTPRYGEAIPFKILPVSSALAVESGSIVYGEAPEFSAQLKYDDELQVENYSLEREGSRVKISIDPADVKIVSADGEDVTSSYTLTGAEKTLYEAPRPVTLRTASLEEVYDGKPHSDSSYEVISDFGLVEGHTLQLHTPELTYVGSTANSASDVKIFDGSGEDVTDRYALNWQAGEIKIVKRPITVTSHDEELVYDGTGHSFGDFSVTEGELCDNEQLKFSAVDVLKANEQGYLYGSVISVMHGDDDVTANYDIAYNFGKIYVHRRPVQLETVAREFVYNGGEQGLSVGDYKLVDGGSAPIEGHTLKIVKPFSAVLANTYKPLPQSYSVVDDNGRDVTENYVISEAIAENFVILPAPLTVVNPSGRFTYDGTPHEFTVSVEGGSQLFDTLSGSITITDWGENGTYETDIVFTITDGDGNDRSANYAVTVNKGLITVDRRPALLSGTGVITQYNGFEQSLTSENFNLISPEGVEGGPAENHTLLVTGGMAAGTDVGEYSSPYEGLEYDILDGDGNSVKKNYDITGYNPGKLTIQTHKISAATAEKAFTYNGKAQTWGEVTATGLIGGHSWQPEIPAELPSVTAAGESKENNFEFDWKIFDGAGNDVSGNYELEQTEYGTLTVIQRGITLTTGSLTGDGAVIYDGQKHSETTIKDISQGEDTGLVEGHIITAEDFPEIEVVGTVDNIPGLVKISDGSADVTKNYNITYEYGTLEVTPRPLKVTVTSDGWTYDGQFHEDSFTVTPEYYGGKQLDGHIFGGVFANRPVSADTYNNFGGSKADLTVTVKSGEADLTENYEITYTGCTLVIATRAVTLATGSLTGGEAVTYDGQPHSKAECSVSAETENELVAGHSAVPVYPQYTDVGDYENKPSDCKIEDGGADVTKNYVISWQPGTISITTRHITVTTGSTTVDHYDGNSHSAPDYSVTSQTKLADGHELQIAYKSFIFANPGYVNEPDSWKIVDGSDNSVFDNYEVDWTYGTIEIKKFRLSLKISSYWWIYDGQPHESPDISTSIVIDPANSSANSTPDPLACTLKPGVEKPAITDVGNVPNKYEVTDLVLRMLSNGEDRSDNYELDMVTAGILEIKPRPIIITTPNGEWTYDGEEHYETSPEKAVITLDTSSIAAGHKDEVTGGGLVTGHTFTATISVWATITDVLYDNSNNVTGTPNGWGEYEFKILAGDKDVTENYLVTKKAEGTLKVLPLAVKFETLSGSWTYDGEYHSTSIQPTADYKLVKDHVVTAMLTQIRDVNEGPAANMASDIKIKSGDKDVTKNYEILPTIPGRLTITPRPIRIKHEFNMTWIYDGTCHLDTAGFGPSYPADYPELPNHEMTVTYTPVTDVCTKSTIQLNAIMWRDGKDITFDFEYGPNTPGIGQPTVVVTITPRPLKLKTESGTFTFDGLPHSVDEVKDISQGENTGLVLDHEIKFIPHGFIYVTEDPNLNNGDPADAEFVITDTEGVIKTHNYEIAEDSEWGTITIEKRKITITTLSGTWVYDGESHGVGYETKLTEGEDFGLAEGHSLQNKLTELKDITDTATAVVTKPNEILGEIVIVDGSGINRTANYEITVVNGDLRIKSPIQAEPYCYEKTYDGKPLELTSIKFVIIARPPDVREEDIEIKLTSQISLTEPGSITIEGIRDKLTTSVTCEDNIYRIDYVGNKNIITINKRNIVVNTRSAEGERNGNNFKIDGDEDNAYWLSGMGLLEGHTVDKVVFTGVLTPGQDTAENTIKNIVIRDASGNDVTEKYYNVQYNYGVLSWSGGSSEDLDDPSDDPLNDPTGDPSDNPSDGE